MFLGGGHRVSIHAPTGGATCVHCRSGTALASFNPRAHGGRDVPSPTPAPTITHVSIHAPTGGATPTNIPTINTDMFQSTRPRGARLYVSFLIVYQCFKILDPRTEVLVFNMLVFDSETFDNTLSIRRRENTLFSATLTVRIIILSIPK